MKKTSSALAALLTLTLAACSSPQDVLPPPATTEPPAPVNSVQPLNLGESFTITHCNGDQPCEVNVTFTGLSLAETCPDGVKYDDVAAMDAEGSIYLTIEGEYEVVQAPTNYSISEMDFAATTADGVSREPDIAHDCTGPDSDSNLSNPVDPGMKRVGALTMAIGTEVTTLRFAPMWEPVSREIDLAQFDVEPGSGERPPAPSATAAPAATQQQSAPTQDSIWSGPGAGYQCPGTDAFVDDPSYCTPENLGAESWYSSPDNPVLRDYYEGGNQNPSSGEIQSWWTDCIATNTADFCRANDPYQ